MFCKKRQDVFLLGKIPYSLNSGAVSSGPRCHYARSWEFISIVFISCIVSQGGPSLLLSNEVIIFLHRNLVVDLLRGTRR